MLQSKTLRLLCNLEQRHYLDILDQAFVIQIQTVLIYLFSMTLVISMPSSQSLILVAIAILLTAVTYLVQTQTQKRAIQQYLASWVPNLSQERRTSTSDTPPRSLTREKKVPDNAPPPSPYRDIFPPSIRGNLLALKSASKSLFSGLGTQSGKIDVDQLVTVNNVIPFEQDYREASSSTFTPMGVTVGEVKALGDFPDYSRLSSVALPEAYKEHKLATAIPRPYRPFRWAYHQTMCNFSSMILCMSH